MKFSRCSRKSACRTTLQTRCRTRKAIAGLATERWRVSIMRALPITSRLHPAPTLYVTTSPCNLWRFVFQTHLPKEHLPMETTGSTKLTLRRAVPTKPRQELPKRRPCSAPVLKTLTLIPRTRRAWWVARRRRKYLHRSTKSPNNCSTIRLSKSRSLIEKKLKALPLSVVGQLKTSFSTQKARRTQDYARRCSSVRTIKACSSTSIWTRTRWISIATLRMKERTPMLGLLSVVLVKKVSAKANRLIRWHSMRQVAKIVLRE